MPVRRAACARSLPAACVCIRGSRRLRCLLRPLASLLFCLCTLLLSLLLCLLLCLLLLALLRLRFRLGALLLLGLL